MFFEMRKRSVKCLKYNTVFIKMFLKFHYVAFHCENKFAFCVMHPKVLL